ncbi:MAG: transketolase [Candidatus Colwellbacteria bacterium CG10_big_fil_rev_8_21_14_0_10_42_22]|uniref:Transketolase n=1 Tax=Candidatus Colwellbacteria bacterium CG10_big_fil_rev_8_21_14_0_10_42_22 TaxID=1974540 RepID=A0A2H0VIM7_9BACT|nr:MAG: transketolase [Candidatus Colwellbacteria bacterium CG10_big_fil_rev_8_21_14_0_10_42_22]
MALAREQKLNKTVFNKNPEKIPIRNGYGEGLVEAGEKHPEVVALCADLKDSTKSTAFAKKFPERFFELGVAEQNMAGVAAGLGVSGKIPFIASYATFSPGRNWEQIRTNISYNNANVKIAGHHAGISVGPDGATHQAIEDIATMRVMANMRVIVPCDVHEARKATLSATDVWGPVYIRYTREETPVITSPDTPFYPGQAEVFWDSKDPKCAIIACGSLVYNALVAAKELESEGIETLVLNNHTIKPMDNTRVLDVVKRCGAVVTVEEHQIEGGMGSAIAELLANQLPTPQEFIGIQGVFGESGKPEELIDKYGMAVKDIKLAVKRVIKRKNGK